MKKIFLSILFVLILTSKCSAVCTRYWVGGGSSATWSATGNTNWGTASNTQDNASVPGASDNVCFDGVGTGASNSTVSALSIASLDMTGYSNVLTHPTATTLTISGSLTLSSTMTYSPATSTSILAFNGGTGTVTTNGKQPQKLTFSGSSGNYTLGSNVTTTQATTLNAGILNLGGYNFSTGISTSNSAVRQINGCGGTLTLYGAGSVFDATTSTNLTITACAANNPFTIAITDTGVSTKTFIGGGKTYGNLTITGSGTGAVVFTGANTFGTLTLGSPKTITFPASTTTTASTISCTGTAGNVITINSSSGGTQATLRNVTNRTTCDYLNLTDSFASGIAFYAGSHSTNASNNGGVWNFSDMPSKKTLLRGYSSN